MSFDITVRFGTRHQRYHTLAVEAPGMAEALRLAAERVPEEILRDADLVEIRAAVDPDARGA